MPAPPLRKSWDCHMDLINVSLLGVNNFFLVLIIFLQSYLFRCSMNRLSQLLRSIDQSGGCRSTASLMKPFHLRARGRNEGIRLTTEFKPSYYMKLVVSLTTASFQICAACDWKERSSPDTNSEDYKRWLESHSPNCRRNFCRSANAIEAEGAIVPLNKRIFLPLVSYWGSIFCCFCL